MSLSDGWRPAHGKWIGRKFRFVKSSERIEEWVQVNVVRIKAWRKPNEDGIARPILVNIVAQEMRDGQKPR